MKKIKQSEKNKVFLKLMYHSQNFIKVLEYVVKKYPRKQK